MQSCRNFDLSISVLNPIWEVALFEGNENFSKLTGMKSSKGKSESWSDQSLHFFLNLEEQSGFAKPR